jgi:hypothetical protein
LIRRIMLLVTAATMSAAMLAVIAGAALGQANPVTVNQQEPVSFETENPCTGELITVEGTMYLLQHENADADEGLHTVYLFKFTGHGVSPSGAEYVIQIGDQIRGISQGDTGMYIQTNNVPMRFISQGENGTTEDDFMTRSVFHITLQPDGAFTTVVENFDSECK